MKMLLVFLLIVFSLNGFSQTKYANLKTGKDTSIAKADSITLTTVFYVTANDLNKYLEKARTENKDKLTIGQFDMMSATFQYIINQMIQEKKNKPEIKVAIGEADINKKP